MLDVRALTCGYGPIDVIRGVSIHVSSGQFVAVIGANGAGKTTLLRAIAGLVRTVDSRTICLDGRNIAGLPTEAIAQHGLQLVPEPLHLFEGMTVHEHLLLGASRLRDRRILNDRLDYVHQLCPWFRERGRQTAETLSGGERKLLAIGRALMGSPRLLLVDEPFLGLAPRARQDLIAVLASLKSAGLTVLLVDQDVHMPGALVDHVYLLHGGRVVADGSVDIAGRADRWGGYCGLDADR
jgi:branched-chain amino acid transport system ATP-binding protein